ncbi:hypothetical protein F4678DRAFT_288300 [Xylaria arbuscula]|nr:hypothetical protein F4678DRAFT_288300 [Xylaria arbuscula]
MEDSANETSIFYQNVWCLYPISGAYTLVQRILFYITVAVAFIFRTHKWISSVAIGSAFVYSLVAAVQSIPMSLQSSLGADPDFIALYIIVITSLWCAIMARIYSPRFIGRNFNSFYTCWIVAFSFLAAFLIFGLNKFTTSTANHVLQIACRKSLECPDPCAGQSPQILFRGGQFDGTTGVVLSSWWETVSNISSASQNSTVGPPSVDGEHVDGYQLNYSAPLFPALIGLFPLLIVAHRNQDRPPRVTRNTAFRRLRLKRVLSSPDDTISTALTFHIMYCIHLFCRGVTYLAPEIGCVKTILQYGLKKIGLSWSAQAWVYERSHLVEVNTKSRERYARNLALAWYILCMISYAAIPVVPLAVTMRVEMVWLSQIPESEELQEIGQWGPIVGLGVTFILAALFRWFAPEPNSHHHSELGEGEYDPFTYEASVAGQAWFWKYQILAAVVKEWRDLKKWFRNPIVSSQEFVRNEQQELVEQTPPTAATAADLSDDNTVQLLPREPSHVLNHNATW